MGWLLLLLGAEPSGEVPKIHGLQLVGAVVAADHQGAGFCEVVTAAEAGCSLEELTASQISTTSTATRASTASTGTGRRATLSPLQEDRSSGQSSERRGRATSDTPRGLADLGGIHPKGSATHQRAPSPRKTALTVRARMTRSRLIDQFST